MKNKYFNSNLGDRRDFWNTKCNPITGYFVPHRFIRGKIVEHKLFAEY
jgi:hypothetical protein